MNRDELIVEARARITWGDDPSSVRYFLTSNGMSVADAEAKMKEFSLERSAEIRGLGIRNILIGAALTGGAGIFFYLLFARSHIPRVNVRSAKGYGFLFLLAFYGLWKLVNGIIYLVRPKSEPGSIPDLSE